MLSFTGVSGKSETSQLAKGVCVCVTRWNQMNIMHEPLIYPTRRQTGTIKKQHTGPVLRDLHLNFSSAVPTSPPSPSFLPPSPPSSPFFFFSHAFTVRYAESSLCCHGLWRLNSTKQAPKCTEPPRRPLNRILPLTSPWLSDNE